MRPLLRRADAFDLGVPCAIALLAAAAQAFAGGGVMQVALGLAMLFFVPGHLLMAAAAPAPMGAGQRAVRAVVALGVSLPLVGLLALGTALLPGGFQAGSIVAAVTAACLALGAVAAWRRRVPGPDAAGAPATEGRPSGTRP